jgi:hypothetical protein
MKTGWLYNSIATDDEQEGESEVRCPMSWISERVMSGDQAASPKAGMRQGPMANSPQDTLSRFGYRQNRVAT